MIELTVDELWDCIYAARMQERYWKLRRRQLTEHQVTDMFTYDDMTEKLSDAKAFTKHLESLAPEESF